MAQTAIAHQEPLLLSNVEQGFSNSVATTRMVPSTIITNTALEDKIEWPVVVLDDEEKGTAMEAVRMVPSAEPAATEMIQTGYLSSQIQPRTPPNTPSSEHFISVHQFIDMVHAVISKKHASPPDEAKVSDDPKTDTTAMPKMPVSRASLLAFKELSEIWDEKAYRYKVVEYQKTPELDDLDKYIFLARGRVDKRSKETTYFIDVKSFTLRDALRKVLRGVPGTSLIEENPSIKRDILYSFLSEIQSCHDGMPLDDREHIRLLIDHITSSYSDTTQRLVALIKEKKITYDLLPVFFKPNELVYTTCKGTKKPRCIRFESGEEKVSPDGLEYFHITGTYLEFDGKILGMVPFGTAILKFPGSQSINSLEAFPLRFHEEKDAVIKKLAETGRKFCSLMGIHHRQYNGIAFQMRKGKPCRTNINGRIMIDPVKFLEDNPNYSRPSVFKSRSGSYIYHDIDDEPSIQLDESTLKKGIDLDELSDEDYLICSVTVLGYSLENKLWQLSVDNISDIYWNESVFDQLQISHESKKTIQALTAQHLARENTHVFDDFIKGKGLGLIILLYGPPGVGKTMTAEALSEFLHMPLFIVSTANLSHNSSADLDTQLSRTFDIGSRWKTLLLFDEADSFFLRRSDESYHDPIVSVFLRKLEYYTGIMFLTTNRVTSFDDAVQSRIHMGVKYPPLGLETRKRIWRGFLDDLNAKMALECLSDAEFDTLARRELNGRQIKNAVRTACALANLEQAKISMSYLQRVLDRGTTFETDFKGTGAIENLSSYN